MKFSIITVCFNALSDLQLTHDSVASQSNVNIEYIVIDGASEDGTVEFLKSSKLVTKWISEKDAGIYDAMNKGLASATGDALLFLNAGDYFKGDLLKTVRRVPGLIAVETKRGGLVSTILKPKSYKSGLPYCHQGILFENKKLRYSLDFKIASDYDFYLRHGYKDLPFVSDPSKGHIYYDNFGVSAQNAAKRDREISRIIKSNFGVFYFLRFLIISNLKRPLKISLQTLKKLVARL